MTRGHWWALGVFGAVAAATWWDPPWPVEQAMHTSLTLVALAALAWAHRRVGLPVRTWVWVLVFLALHTIAARWIYSFVPYDDWTGAVLGVRLSDVFGWHRNHFDRLVHFAYGVCLTMVLPTGPQQGDVWDAHKDMALALLGAAAAAAARVAAARRGHASGSSGLMKLRS
jgi:putative membrane protein